MAPWLIITGSGLDDWIYERLISRSLLIIISYGAIANLPTSQITRTRSTLVLILLCTLCTPFCNLLRFLDNDPKENTVFYYKKCVFIGSLPTNRCPAAPAFASAGKCLATHCLAMDMAWTTYKTLLAMPFLSLFARTSGEHRNRSTCHNIYCNVYDEALPGNDPTSGA
jgi:hypothetical protein